MTTGNGIVERRSDMGGKLRELARWIEMGENKGDAAASLDFYRLADSLQKAAADSAAIARIYMPLPDIG